MQEATKSYRKHHFNCEIFESIPFHIKIKSKIVYTENSEDSIEAKLTEVMKLKNACSLEEKL